MAKRKYLVLLRNQSTDRRPASEKVQQIFVAYNAWKEKFKNDILDMGDRLESEGRVVTASGVSDGPFVGAEDVIGGYMMIAAESYEGAVEVVRACPAVRIAGMSLEIREMTGART